MTKIHRDSSTIEEPADLSGQSRDWHLRAADACLAALESRPEGLSSAEVEARRVRFGANVLDTEPVTSIWRRLFRQFHNVLLYVLLGSAVVTALLGHWVDTAVIAGVVLINALVGFIQEGRAEHAMRTIRGMLRLRAVVLRQDRAKEVDAAGLVPGDVVILQAGDRVPADLRLLDSKRLEADQAILTGESVPTEKSQRAIMAEVALPERHNMAFAGTLITRGWARALVVATGESTELGRISGALRGIRQLTTPLLEKIDAFARRLSLLILGFAGGIALFGAIVHGYAVPDMLVAAVSIAVAAIPEGLPPVITITLAIGVQLMSRRRAIVRRLPAVETLGEVDIICTDKTGTLTANEMTVCSVVTADARFEVTGVGYTAFGELIPVEPVPDQRPRSLQELLLAALNCNDAQLRIGADGYSVTGDPTESALAVLSAKGGLDPQLPAFALERVDVIPFETEQRYMATLHRLDGTGVVYVKGAPEAVLAMCKNQMTDGDEVPLDRSGWLDATSAMAAEGQRVLALARCELTAGKLEIVEAWLSGSLTLLGVVGLMDPPRSEVPGAIARCRSAGIRVKMITGDHADTAGAVARELGLATDAEVVTGADLDRLDDDEFAAIAMRVDVFARTSPRHKLRLVSALQDQGHIVAMTGDGVNDAPALKRADVGIAMGRKGTEAAREVSDVVLADDNFTSIVRAVEVGRNIYDNIRKSVVFLLPTSVTEALVIALAIVIGYQLPMTPVQILWINMITAVTLGIALAFEPGDPRVMQRTPRSAQAPLLSGLVVWRTAFVSLLMLGGIAWVFSVEAAQHGIGYARTAAVNTLVVFEAVYLVSARYLRKPSFLVEGLFGNRVVLLAILLVGVFQVLFTYTRPFQLLFESEPLDVSTWTRIGLLGVTVFVVVELEKLARRLSGIRPGEEAAGR